MMSPSSALANRSFLYNGSIRSSGCGGTVYATLDSLALKRASLPLKLVPVEERLTIDDVACTPIRKSSTETIISKSIPDVTTASTPEYSLPPNSLETDVSLSSSSSDLTSPRQNGSAKHHLENNKNTSSLYKKKPQQQQPKAKQTKTTEPTDNNKKKERREFTFAKNVLHYVPMTSRRYYRKSRKLATKSLSLKSLGVVGSSHQDKCENLSRTLKTRSLSRDELKYVTISTPSNFVHIASATRKSLMIEEDRVIKHEEKYADLRGGDYAEIALVNGAKELEVNDSFLWRTLPRCKKEEGMKGQVDDGDYDDVGPPVVVDKQIETKQESKTGGVEPEHHPYNGVAEPDGQDAYDDVGPGLQEATQPDEQLYDDVMPPLRSTYVEEKVELRETLVDDEDVYDDVGLPTVNTQQQQVVVVMMASTECHERVNSLYAGSSASGSIQLALSAYDNKESEWEDLDDAALSGTKPGTESTTSSPSKRRPGQRWSRKVRRQRSRASRKSSGRSSSRTRTQQQLNRAYSDSSDDSNYETLETYEPDDFSSDSEPESNHVKPTSEPLPQASSALLHLSLREPPSRPIPPPPREASLGHALGLRMKMLRRTWSITKGSLGRMRRRASGDGEQHQQQHEATAGSSAGKYFSFKKHFRKSQSASGLSTFYLDKAGGQKEGEGERDRQEPIYTNGNWYQEAGLYRNKEVSKEEPFVDHYSVLAEEPLYQFYAAAATRVAFESDSDGYEEVEELTPSAETTDLARPGHRTLWYQTPQVINSGLLQSLTMEERKIQEAKFEILTSEASYLNSLRVLENEFASSYELTQEILAPAERDRLFGSVPDVLVASERFLAELEAVWREDPMLGGLPELLLKHGERSANVYVDYCSNQVSIDTTLKELKAKKGYKFLETVSRIEMHPACHSLSLHSFLMLPMQRITRLPLLADAVLSKLSVEHSERLSWERVLAALSQIVAKCNEAARLAERRNEMEALARKLEYSTKVPPISLQDRELIRSGTVVHLSMKSDTEYKLTFGKKFHKTPLMLMLLTDYLLVTRLKSNSNEDTYSVIETCKRSLVALESAPEDSPFAGRHAMVLTLLENHAGRQVEYVLTCDNDTEKERWLDAVSPPKPSCLGETLYESWDCPQVMALYSYAPRQPDELALQPGDVINVLRKMNDGWLFGEKLLDGEQGWFPGNFTKEVASEHVRARNLRQRHRFLALSGSVLQRRAKQSLYLL